jgi:recombination protein RecT
VNALVEFNSALQLKKNAIRSRLPSHMRDRCDRMVQVAVAAAVKNPAILRCTQESIMLSVMQAAELGLEPGGALGEGYLVPYGQTCQFIPGYRGLISLARRSGQISSIEAHAVYAMDDFDFAHGLDSFLTHKPYMGDEDRGPLRAVYAIAKLVGGGKQYEVMTKGDVEQIRKRSKAGSNGPWVTDFSEMARKTVIRRLFKYLPVSVEMARALEIQSCAESGEFDPSAEVFEDPQADDLARVAAEKAAARSASQSVSEAAP